MYCRGRRDLVVKWCLEEEKIKLNYGDFVVFMSR